MKRNGRQVREKEKGDKIPFWFRATAPGIMFLAHTGTWQSMIYKKAGPRVDRERLNRRDWPPPRMARGEQKGNRCDDKLS